MNTQEIILERAIRKKALQAICDHYPATLPLHAVIIACKAHSEAYSGIADTDVRRAIEYLESCGHVERNASGYRATSDGIDSLGHRNDETLLRGIVLNALYVMRGMVDLDMLKEYVGDCAQAVRASEIIRAAAYLTDCKLSSQGSGMCWKITHHGIDYLQNVSEYREGVYRASTL